MEEKELQTSNLDLEHKLVESKDKNTHFLKFSGTLFGAAIVLNLAPYVIPYLLRTDEVQESTKEPRFDKQLMKAGLLFGASMVPFHGIFYSEHKELLAIPITTNIISGLYELGRCIYTKRMEEK